MANEVIIEFKADTRGIESALNVLEKTGQIDKKTADQIRANNKAWKERTDEIKKHNDSLKDFQKEVDKLNGPGQPKVSNESLNSFDKLSSTLKNLRNLIGLAFTTQQIVQFTREAISAFAAAERGQQQLLYALKNQKEVQKDLIRQANQLKDSAGIDDDIIIKAQTFLAIQGRTVADIKRTTQAAIQLSTVLGVDVVTAAEMLDATFEGNIGKLGRLDASFKDLTQEQLANGAAVDIINEKYKGFAESTLNTAEGQIRKNELAIEDLKKSIGERLAPAFANAQRAALSFFEKMLVGFNFLANPTEEAAKQLEKYLDQVQKVGEQKFANASLKELQQELIRVQNLWTANDLEAAQKQRQIDVIRSLIAAKRRERDAENEAAGKKYIETLEALKKKLEELTQKQLTLEDPLGKGYKENLALLKEIAKVKERIAEIDGTAAAKREQERTEERKKNQALEVTPLSPINPFASTTQIGDVTDTSKNFTGLEGFFIDQAKAAEIVKDIEDALVQSFTDGIFGAIQSAYEAQIAALENFRDSQDEILDENLEKNQQRYNDEIISAREFRTNEKKLLDEKTKNEEQAAKKIRELKRQAAIAERLEKIFEIAINTASNIVKNPGLLPPGGLIPFWLGLGATETAAVLAAPLPKFHSGRLARGSGEQLAIIQKEETITDAKKSRQYAPVLEAIHYGRIPAMALNDFVKTFTVRDFSRSSVSSSTVDFDMNEMGSVFSQATYSQKEYLRKIYNVLKDTKNERPDYRGVH